MAVFKVIVQVDLGDQYITNTYHVEAGSLSEAAGQGEKILTYQKTILPAGFAFNAVRASTMIPNDNSFYTIPVDVQGTRVASSDPMPMFCRFRVDFSIGYRRPLRKFLLVPLEGDQNSGQFSQAARDFVTNNYITPMLADPIIQLVASDGSPVNSATVNPAVGMRQLRRGSKRKNPVI